MTSGSWSFGTGSISNPIAAERTWNGTDGKYEAAYGEIRSKWNNYELYHHKWQQGSSNPGRYAAVLSNWSLSVIKSNLGWNANEDLRLLDKLAEEVRGHTFDLGINMAEIKKTYGTVVTNLHSVGAGLRNLKRGNISRALRNLGANRRGRGPLRAKDLSGRWLETQYAFLPLISQSYEAAKALEALTGARELRFRVSSSTKRYTEEGSSSPTVYSMPVHWTYSKKILAELKEPLSDARALGLTNPAEIAWEVVPYSFVVDWFIPVGTYIGTWGVIPYLNGRFCTTERGAAKNSPVGPGSTPGNTWKLYIAKKREQSFRLKRSVSTALSIPTPTFNSVPRALSPKRILNAVALIHQQLK